MFTAPCQFSGMGGQRQSNMAKAFLALGLLGLMIVCAPATRADEHGEEKKGIKIPGFADKDAIGYFQFQPFNIPVIRNGKVARILTLTVTMETKGDDNKTKIMAQRYQLHDAFLRDIHGVAAFQRSDCRVIDPAVVKTRLMAISDRLLGEGTVRNILVQSIFDRSV